VIAEDGFRPARLPDGGLLSVSVVWAESFLVVRSDAEGKERGRVELHYPGSGLADGGIVLSPSGRYAVVGYYSGQSEESFLLLALSSSLELIASPAYSGGEVASYAFSPDESRLLVILPRACDAWWVGEQPEEILATDSNGSYLKFATLLLCDCDTGAISRSWLHVVPWRGDELPGSWDGPDLDARFLDGSTVSVAMPWGEASFDLPDPLTTVRLEYRPSDSEDVQTTA